jgi:Hpt domain
MESSSSHKTFLFSDAINSKYIIDLYAGDYVMIEETFTDVLHEYDAFVERLVTGYREKDVPALKSAIHKIKPLFGFVGLLYIQSLCQDFETACQHSDFPALVEPFNLLKANILNAKSVIESEKIRLSSYNRS